MWWSEWPPGPLPTLSVWSPGSSRSAASEAPSLATPPTSLCRASWCSPPAPPATSPCWVWATLWVTSDNNLWPGANVVIRWCPGCCSASSSGTTRTRRRSTPRWPRLGSRFPATGPESPTFTAHFSVTSLVSSQPQSPARWGLSLWYKISGILSCIYISSCKLMLTFSSVFQIFKAAQPALLYLVPFTLLPLFAMAYLKVNLISVSWLTIHENQHWDNHFLLFRVSFDLCGLSLSQPKRSQSINQYKH